MTGYNPRNQAAHDARESVDLVKQALAQMWPVPQENKQAVVDEQFAIMRNELCPFAVRVSAAKNLIAMGALNLKALDTIAKLTLRQGPEQQTENIDWDSLIHKPETNSVEEQLKLLSPPPKHVNGEVA